MCRNIKTLHNFVPPATDEEIYLSSLQFVRKLSGFTRPSQANQAAFDRAYAECKADASWQTHVNENTGHDVMVDQPEWLADILMKA